MKLTTLILGSLALLPTTPRPPAPPCDADNAGLKLPDGFCAILVREGLGPVRHLAIAPNGDIFAAKTGGGGGVIVLRDTNGDGKADTVAVFASGAGGTGIRLRPDAVYFAADNMIIRYPWTVGKLSPTGPADTIAKGLPPGGHSMKSIAFGKDGTLYVSFGSHTNSCQVKDRTTQSPGINPCTELSERAGIWTFDPKRTGQTAADGKRFATGLRNPESIDINPATGVLYMATHGRDQLTENWGWPAEEGRENPSEGFGPVAAGADYGWPYCFHNPRTKQMLQNPEYGGDGKKVGDCDKKTAPAIGFPAHWAPNDLAFYTGTMFPAKYQGGAFIAFHGSWNRAPAPQEGYRVVFVPFQGGKPGSTWEDFVLPAGSPTSVRPTGIATGPDGSLYVSADTQGKVWRIVRK